MLESLGVKLLDWGISQAADLLFEQTQAQLKQRLNKDDLQTAIALGVKAAKAYELELLAKLDDKQQRQFKEAVFSDSDVQGELQRPFRDEGKPRIEYLIAGFRKVAGATGKPLGENALKPWLEAFADAYFERTSALRFDLAKQDYCRQLINYYDELQFLGIDDVDPNEDSKAIESIFVMPDAVAERPPNQEGMNFLGRQAYFDWHETYSFEEEAADLGRQKALIQEQKRINESAEKQWSGAKVSASNLLNQQGKSKRVLLGAPGSGKTTLMSYFTVKLAKEALREDGETPVAGGWGLSAGTLPILIRIRDLATKSDLTVLEYAAQFAKTTLGCQPLPGGFFERWLQEGKALILLDGLDEVAEDGKRQDIANKIDNFLRQEQFAQNPAIITSRPAGYYRSFFNTTDYPHYLLQPFDDGQIKKFISNWYDQRESSQVEADGCKESLRKALDEQERIKALARNPLLLTVIALIHRWRAELPRDRHELYDRAVNTLIRTWDKKREITSHEVLQYLKLDDLRPGLWTNRVKEEQESGRGSKTLRSTTHVRSS
ncbi:NACHT domain-containing protein [Vacuolonema iberomarrocanum]|uniref:NACHT domain-containing protein n=1 Tax=Vacuolonema iberomarrocanum TaxID=3454632 RepID=UPI0019F625FD|nr:NACHT domain-containing protein [filamentous cyanobacterium LEGE 07170]